MALSAHHDFDKVRHQLFQLNEVHLHSHTLFVLQLQATKGTGTGSMRANRKKATSAGALITCKLFATVTSTLLLREPWTFMLLLAEPPRAPLWSTIAVEDPPSVAPLKSTPALLTFEFTSLTHPSLLQELQGLPEQLSVLLRVFRAAAWNA